MRLPEVLVARAAPGVAPFRYFAALVGPLVLVASLGVQLILAALLLVPQPTRDIGELTQWGRSIYFPERDVNVYVGGVLLALVLALATAWLWSRATGRWGLPGGVWGPLGVRIAVAGGATALCLSRWLEARLPLLEGEGVAPSHLIVFAAIGLATAAAGAPWELFRGSRAGAPQAPVGRQALDGTVPDEPQARGRLRLSWHDVAFPLVIFALVYIPDWRHLSGRLFLADGLFHWDFYAMGPSLAFSDGKALGTDFYAAYGLGWPTFFGLVSNGVAPAYGWMIGLGVLAGSIYFMGVYLLLRLVVHRPWLAAAGTGLAMLQLFVGMGTEVVWVLPSLTVMRWIFDIWVLIALVLHRRTGHLLWAVAAGGLVGMAVLFGIDTGLALAAAVIFFWICSAVGGPDNLRARDVAWWAGAAVISLATGLAVATRGTLFAREFWAGWMEALLDFRGGYGQAPVATVPDAFAVTCFVILLSSYLTVAAIALAKVLHRRAALVDVLTGTLSVYGLMNLIHFVSRSVGNTSTRLMMPLAIILAAGGGRGYLWAANNVRRRWATRGALQLKVAVLSGSALVLVLAAMATPEWFLLDPIRSYPSLAARAVRGAEPEGLCLMSKPRDICGLPYDLKGTVDQYRSVAGRLDQLEGKSLAVIDENGSLFYVAGGRAPFSRYPRVFINVFTTAHRRRVIYELDNQPPEYVLTRAPLEADSPNFKASSYFGVGPRADSFYLDVWTDLLDVVRSRYRLVESLENFELWTLTPEVGGPE